LHTASKGVASIRLFHFVSVSQVCIRSTFDVRDYGAKGDGHTKDTIAIRKAVAAIEEVTHLFFSACLCGEFVVLTIETKQAGGGVLLFPAGSYLTAPFNLTTGTTLFVRALSYHYPCYFLTNRNRYRKELPSSPHRIWKITH
jgi:hypothetical protein